MHGKTTKFDILKDIGKVLNHLNLSDTKITQQFVLEHTKINQHSNELMVKITNIYVEEN